MTKQNPQKVNVFVIIALGCLIPIGLFISIIAYMEPIYASELFIGGIGISFLSVCCLIYVVIKIYAKR